MLLSLASCTRPHVRPLEYLTAPGIEEPFPSGSYAELPGDARRLPEDVQRAVERVHWGLIHFEGPLPSRPADAMATTVRAEALLPDGRTAAIVAWPSIVGGVGLAIRVGPFGDPREERAFAAVLAKTLAGKPKPKRGGTFEIPE